MKKSPPMLKMAVYMSYVRPAFLYGSEAWCLKESEMGKLPRAESFIVRAIEKKAKQLK